MAATLVLRTVKGSPLTNIEVDNNFSNLNTFGDVVSSNIGVLSALTTSSTGNIVFAVNSLVTRDTTINSNIGVLTNLTTTSNTNVVSAINEIKAGNLSQFGTTTSAQLLSIITDETGSGNLVFSTSPTLVTPALGTPSAIVLTNATGTVTNLTLVTPNVGTPSYINLTNATGTVTNLNLVTPNVGTPSYINITNAAGTASSITLANPTISAYTENVIAIGTVSSASTLSIANGTFQTVTLTASTACTFTMPTATAGKSFILLVKQAASTGNGTATFTGVKFGTAGAPTITATAGKMDLLTFVSDGTNWYGSASQGYTP